MECNVHPGTEAVTTCIICGSPICPLCASETNQVHLCYSHYHQRVEQLAAQLSPAAAKMAEQRRKAEAKPVKEKKRGKKGKEPEAQPTVPAAQAVFAPDTGMSLWERETELQPGTPAAPTALIEPEATAPAAQAPMPASPPTAAPVESTFVQPPSAPATETVMVTPQATPPTAPETLGMPYAPPPPPAAQPPMPSAPFEETVSLEGGVPAGAPPLSKKELAQLKKEEARRLKEEERQRKLEEKQLRKMQKKGMAPPAAQPPMPSARPDFFSGGPAPAAPSAPAGIGIEALPQEIEFPASLPTQEITAPPPPPAPEPAPSLTPPPPPPMPDFGDLAGEKPQEPGPADDLFGPPEPSPGTFRPPESPPPQRDLGMPEGFFD